MMFVRREKTIAIIRSQSASPFFLCILSNRIRWAWIQRAHTLLITHLHFILKSNRVKYIRLDFEVEIKSNAYSSIQPIPCLNVEPVLQGSMPTNIYTVCRLFAQQCRVYCSQSVYNLLLYNPHLFPLPFSLLLLYYYYYILL